MSPNRPAAASCRALTRIRYAAVAYSRANQAAARASRRPTHSRTIMEPLPSVSLADLPADASKPEWFPVVVSVWQRIRAILSDPGPIPFAG